MTCLEDRAWRQKRCSDCDASGGYLYCSDCKSPSLCGRCRDKHRELHSGTVSNR